VFFAFYSSDQHEIRLTLNRFQGSYAWTYWVTVFCNVVSIQLLWFPRMRANVVVLLAVSILVVVGMWMERFMLIVTSLYRDFLPSSWGMFYPTRWDFVFLFGSIGLFFALFLLFLRYLPMVSMFELRKSGHSEHRRP
jgi:Ni/Fe-hydrogenase subunit HybB-like protein